MFTDLTSNKLRSALVLYEGEKDVVVAFICSQIDKLKPIDIIINEKNVEFKQTGLKLCSTIKLDKVATISKELIVGEIGEIGPKIKREVNRKITEIYSL